MSDWQKILIAVNDTDVAMRAVRYVGEMVVEVNVLSVHLFHVFPDPPPNLIQQDGALEEYKKNKQGKGNQAITRATGILKEYGIKGEVIESDVRMAEGQTISQAVLDAQKKWKCGTVVVGKRGVCKAEEFLFGSISNALAREAHDFAVWVVG